MSLVIVAHGSALKIGMSCINSFSVQSVQLIQSFSSSSDAHDIRGHGRERGNSCHWQILALSRYMKISVMPPANGDSACHHCTTGTMTSTISVQCEAQLS